MSHYELMMLLKTVQTEADTIKAKQAALAYTVEYVSAGLGTEFDAGVDIGYANCMRNINHLEPIEFIEVI